MNWKFMSTVRNWGFSEDELCEQSVYIRRFAQLTSVERTVCVNKVTNKCVKVMVWFIDPFQI
jgi:hypothetical protein